ncbi:DsrE family protein [Curtobacterium ammoniigenes]|uniref:DsrE family protein n=1 Tax=Curtobacterium ammoniigenes TaxID=395387 RepID=UPI00082CC631|nr:DsrE family protein [Curtobacterium ammoniigenes]
MTADRTLLIHAFAETPEVLTAALRVARHSVERLGPTAEVQVVVQGGAVRGLTVDSAFADEVSATVTEHHVRILACENSMQRVGVLAEALLDQVGTVPAAATYMAEQQWAGAAYVRI